MFTSLASYLDWFIKLVEIVLFLLLLSYVGLGFVFRLIFKLVRIKFSNLSLSQADSQILDLQLIRLFHGITLEKPSYIELFSNALASGKLQPPTAWLIPSFRPAGKYKYSKTDAWLICIFIASITISSMCVFYPIFSNVKYNYAEFNDGHQKILISQNKLYDPVNSRYYSKHRCKKLSADHKSIIQKGCEYILTSDPDMQQDLADAIKISNSILHFAGIGFSVIFFFIFFNLITYPRYYKFNNDFYDLLRHEKRPTFVKNKLIRYKEALPKNAPKAKHINILSSN